MMSGPTDVLNGGSDVPEALDAARCTAVYNGKFWRGLQCREDAGHDQRAHVDRYAGIGEDSQRHYSDQHGPHAHHVDMYGRTW